MLKNGGVLLGASMLFVIVQLLLFHIPTYRALLDPASSTASFEAAIAQLRTWTADPKRDVLVLGDSRIYAGLDPAVASKASSTLRFLNAGVPGTTPRCLLRTRDRPGCRSISSRRHPRRLVFG